MFYFAHSCLTKNFIKLVGVLSCVMALSIILFHNCNRVLADVAENTLVMWNNKIFRAPFTVESSSFLIHFSCFGCRRFVLPEINTKYKKFSYEISKVKSDAVNK